MKRLMLAFVMILCLLPMAASAEESPLFPARGDNGKWGYIDLQGAFVIPPQFDGAESFRGNYAVITVLPEGSAPLEELDLFGMPDCQGVIDRGGNIVLEPSYHLESGYNGDYYGGKDTGIWFVTRLRGLVWDDDEGLILHDNFMGFFDIPSGFFSGLKWIVIWPWTSDSRLIPVADVHFQVGYADRTTGDLVIPCRYYSVNPSSFHGGVTTVSLIDDNGDPTGFFLINEAGETIPLPEGIHALIYEGAFYGRVMVEDDAGLFGYADPTGQIVISPEYILANSFEETPLGITATVKFTDGDWGVINPDGNVLVRWIGSDRWSLPDFKDGYRSEKAGENACSLIDMRGNTVMTLTVDHIVSISGPNENGLCWFAVDEKDDETHRGERRWGLADLQGNIVADPIWIKPNLVGSSEGFTAVVQIINGERKMGYLNDAGILAIPCVYDDAGDFENGLARVRIENRCGYIDHDGNEVYFWTDESYEQ